MAGQRGGRQPRHLAAGHRGLCNGIWDEDQRFKRTKAFNLRKGFFPAADGRVWRLGRWVSAVIRAANESTLMMIIGVLECSDSTVDKTEVPWEDKIKKLELRFPDLIVGDRD